MAILFGVAIIFVGKIILRAIYFRYFGLSNGKYAEFGAKRPTDAKPRAERACALCRGAKEEKTA